MVEREQVCDELRRPVEVEQPAPELPGRLRCRRDRLEDRDDALARPAGPVLLHPVDRVAGRLPVELEQRTRLRPSSPASRIVEEPPRLPPLLRPRVHTGALRKDLLVERRERPRRLLEVDDADRPARLERNGEAGVLARERDRADTRGETVAVATVDRS